MSSPRASGSIQTSVARHKVDSVGVSGRKVRVEIAGEMKRFAANAGVATREPKRLRSLELGTKVG